MCTAVDFEFLEVGANALTLRSSSSNFEAPFRYDVGLLVASWATATVLSIIGVFAASQDMVRGELINLRS